MDYAKQRTRLLDWVRKQLIGPASKEDRLTGFSPLDRYPTGILFPITRGDEGIDPASTEGDGDENLDLHGGERSTQESAEPAVTRRRFVPPSSVGFSFYARGKNLSFEVFCSAARYTEISGGRDAESGQFAGRQFERSALGGEADTFSFAGPERKDIWQDEHQKPRCRVSVDNIPRLWRYLICQEALEGLPDDLKAGLKC